MTTAFTTDERLSLLIHAPSKTGKTTVAATAPPPILVLDAEGGWRFIPARKVTWDPSLGGPPEYDGTWDVCIVNVREWETVNLVYNWVRQYLTPFVSIVIDSITEIQRRCKSNLKGSGAMQIQDWGVLLAQMDSVIRGFRDLALIPQLGVRCIVFVAETRQSQSGKWVPYMQGQISVSLPYWVDITGYLYADYEPDVDGQPTIEVRRLLIRSNAQYEAGERVQGKLGGLITIRKGDGSTVDTHITDWMNIVFDNPTHQIESSNGAVEVPTASVANHTEGQ